MKTYTTKTAKGNELRFEISYNKEVVEVERNLDGYIVTANEVSEEQEIKLNVNGQLTAEGYYLYIDNNENGIYIRMGNKAITLTAQQAADLNKIFAEVKEEGKSEEAKAIENEEIEKEIEEAKAIVEKAEQQRDIPTYQEARAREKSYNNLHNEGGEGYVPHIVDINQYNRAKSLLKNMEVSKWITKN